MKRNYLPLVLLGAVILAGNTVLSIASEYLSRVLGKNIFLLLLVITVALLSAWIISIAKKSFPSRKLKKFSNHFVEVAYDAYGLIFLTVLFLTCLYYFTSIEDYLPEIFSKCAPLAVAMFALYIAISLIVSVSNQKQITDKRNNNQKFKDAGYVSCSESDIKPFLKNIERITSADINEVIWFNKNILNEGSYVVGVDLMPKYNSYRGLTEEMIFFFPVQGNIGSFTIAKSVMATGVAKLLNTFSPVNEFHDEIKDPLLAKYSKCYVFLGHGDIPTILSLTDEIEKELGALQMFEILSSGPIVFSLSIENGIAYMCCVPGEFLQNYLNLANTLSKKLGQR